MSKLLVTPVVTPLGLPSEKELEQVWPEGIVKVHIGEWQMMSQQLRDGAPEHFHGACRRLLESLKGKTDAVIVGAATGEGVGFWINQYSALLSAMKKACPPDIRIMAGLLGRDDMVRDQAIAAYNSWIPETVLGLNHTWDNLTRFHNAMSVFGSHERLWLDNTPTFQPASLAFIDKCMQDCRVVWIKDSSVWTVEIRLRELMRLAVDSSVDFQVLSGDEAVYWELSEHTFAHIRWLVSGISNAHPEILRRFTDNPRNWASQELQEMNNHIMSLSLRRRRSHLSEAIEAHILWLKLKLLDLGIFDRRHVWLYSMKQWTLFQTYHKN